MGERRMTMAPEQFKKWRKRFFKSQKAAGPAYPSTLPSQEWFNIHADNSALRAKRLIGASRRALEMERDNFTAAGVATAFCQGYTPDQLKGVTLKEVVEVVRIIELILSHFNTPPRSSTAEPDTPDTAGDG